MTDPTTAVMTRAIDAIVGRRGAVPTTQPRPQLAGGDGERRRFLVTGAAGSIGAMLVERLLPFADRVVALDQDDTGLQRLRRHHEDPRLVPWLANLRDSHGVERLFRLEPFDVVLHCAAVKHVDLAETFPREAVLTNIVGSANLLAAAVARGCTFVNVSTDKAASANTVLGRSKRIGERLVAWYGSHGAQATASVRLGNVLGSRGSVLESFVARAVAGQPLPITDPRMERLFMTFDEVVDLMAAAAAHPHDGRCLVPDLGRAIAIEEVARLVLDAAGCAGTMAVVGPRIGDNMHEVMIGADEKPWPASLKRGPTQIAVEPLDPAVASAMAASMDDRELLAMLVAACGVAPLPAMGAPVNGTST